jgi:GcrA cell cycle regulator
MSKHNYPAFKGPSLSDSVWTDDREEALKKLWADGLSASQIAGELGGVTRNAIIGKVHRLGLPGRSKPRGTRRSKSDRPRRRPGRFLVDAGTSMPLRSAAALEEPIDVRGSTEQCSTKIAPLEQRVGLQQLNDSTCRWPIGDPSNGMTFCGGRPIGDLPYCVHHSRIAYEPVRSRNLDRLARAGSKLPTSWQ